MAGFLKSNKTFISSTYSHFQLKTILFYYITNCVVQTLAMEAGQQSAWKNWADRRFLVSRGGTPVYGVCNGRRHFSPITRRRLRRGKDPDIKISRRA